MNQVLSFHFTFCIFSRLSVSSDLLKGGFDIYVCVFVFGSAGSSLLHGLFSWLWWAGAPLQLRWGGFSHCGAWALGREGSVDVARGLSSCGPQALLPQGLWAPPGSGFGTYIYKQILYHWASREALCIFLWLLAGQKWNFFRIRCVGAKGKCTNIYINSMITGFKIQLYFCLFSWIVVIE